MSLNICSVSMVLKSYKPVRCRRKFSIKKKEDDEEDQSAPKKPKERANFAIHILCSAS